MRKLCWRCFWEDPFDILDLNLTLWFEANVESLSRRNQLGNRSVKVRKGSEANFMRTGAGDQKFGPRKVDWSIQGSPNRV